MVNEAVTMMSTYVGVEQRLPDQTTVEIVDQTRSKR